jgi:hypothetical protein
MDYTTWSEPQPDCPTAEAQSAQSAQRAARRFNESLGYFLRYFCDLCASAVSGTSGARTSVEQRKIMVRQIRGD